MDGTRAIGIPDVTDERALVEEIAREKPVSSALEVAINDDVFAALPRFIEGV
jgi:hypothetical protein